MKTKAKLLAMTALLTPLAFGPLHAQAPTTPPAEQPGMNSPAPAPEGTIVPEAPGGSAQAPAPVAPGNTAAAPGSADYITEQSPQHIVASSYMGQPVYTAEDQSIGNVNDLVLEEGGGIVAVVVGVGGFLGLGQKNVALPMEKITVTRDTSSGDLHLTTIETAESLNAAPEFRTLRDQVDQTATGATE